MATFCKDTADYAIPADLLAKATALMSDLAADGRAVCQMMHYHLYLMTTTDTPDVQALAEDVDVMTEYLKATGGQE